MHVRIEHHVQAADLVNEAEEIFQIHILQVDRNRFAGVLRARTRRIRCQLSLLLRRQVHCRLDCDRARTTRLRSLWLHSGVGACVYQFRSRFVGEL